MAESTENKASRLYCILSGGDWADAGVGHVVLPAGVDIEAERQVRDRWYNEEYYPALGRGEKPGYLSFTQWLVERCGGQRLEDEDVVVIESDD